MTPAVEKLLAGARASLQAGDLEAARRSCERAVQQAPTWQPAVRLLATVLVRQGASDEAVPALRRVLDRDPADVEALATLGGLLTDRGSAEEALPYLERALALRTGQAALHFNYGNCLAALGRTEAALREYERTIGLAPALAVAHNNRGSMLKRLGRQAEAFESFRHAVDLAPNLASARNNLGVAFTERGDAIAAIVELEAATRLNPGNVESHGELAHALLEAGQFARAFEEFERALELAPEHDSLWYNLGVALLRFGDLKRAVEVLELLSRRRPDDAELLVSLAQTLLLDGNARAALEVAERARTIAPDLARITPTLLAARQELCDWREIGDLTDRMLRLPPIDLPPLALASLVDDPVKSLESARTYMAFLGRAWPFHEPVRTARRPGPLRIAYLSCDFGDHPVGHSIVEVFERHDRRRVEVIGVAIRHRAESAIGRRLSMACDRFYEVAGQSDAEVAALLRREDVDVAVDLAGHTMGARPLIFAARGARVQAAYLGYPGSTGSPWIDYLIADGDVLPAGAEAFYGERLVRLSGCFFPSDTTQVVGPVPSRASAGLPAAAFVYACITKHTRILPQTFAVWMQILGATGDSVLWLNGSGGVRDALRGQAAAHGVDPARLFFAQRVDDRAAYLGRLGVADLFLDVFPYAGHSTVRDALWAGLPVVTREGRGFQTRVAPSLLRAAGLAEWIATDAHSYAEIAVAARQDPQRIRQARATLASHGALPLFDMRRLTSDLESSYELMLQRWERNDPPDHLRIPGGVPAKVPDPLDQVQRPAQGPAR